MCRQSILCINSAVSRSLRRGGCDTFDAMQSLAFFAIASILISSPQAPTQQFGGLHPAFQCDGVKAAALFDKGYKDADSFKDLDKPSDFFYKGSGRSWMWVLPLSYRAYQSGFLAKKKYLEDDKVKSKREALLSSHQIDSFDIDGGICTLPNVAAQTIGSDGSKTYVLRDVRLI